MHKSGKTQAPIALPSDAPEAPKEKIMVVRYSLPDLLAEIKLEREASSMAMEKLHQAEITKLFASKPKVRRGKAQS